MTNLKLRIYAPNEQLKPFVRRVLITLGGENTNENVPIGPTGFSYITYSRYPITLHYHDRTVESDEKLYLVGQLEKEQPYFTVKGNFFHIGLEILPSLPYYLFRVEGKDLVDTGMSIMQLNPEFAGEFLNHAETEPDPDKVAQLLQEHTLNFLQAVKPIKQLEEILKIIYKYHGNIVIDELKQSIGWSDRHIRRQFKKIIGLNPKQYCKIIQFNAVFEAIKTDNEKMIYDLALENGYYDHAHFINDFKTHLGKSPRNFLKSEHSFLKSYLGKVRS